MSRVFAQAMHLAVAVTVATSAFIAAAEDTLTEKIIIHTIGKKVSDFPLEDDFSSPEASYATIIRLLATGTGDWISVSCSRLREEFPGGSSIMKAPTEEAARMCRSAEILETRIHNGTYAQVAARLDRPNRPIDIRHFELEGGRWLNAGNSNASTLEEAAQEFERMVRRRKELAKIQTRESVADPDALLSEHVIFLHGHEQRPKDFVLQALARHKLVAVGEIHHRPTYWELNSEVVQDPRFATSTGTIYLELPMHAQPLVDEFLAATVLDTAPVIAMLRDNLWMGWPDQAMLDFFVAVWHTNQKADHDHRIRIVLVDMKRPWRELIREDNLRKYDLDRDKLMAESILTDMQRRSDQRHALFIVGYAHIENVRLAGFEHAVANAGRHLRERLNAEMFTIVQHGPVLTNMGRVSGRACQGLFDEAFRANGDLPIAFSLKGSPFGNHRFDLDGDRCDTSMSLFAGAFDGYVYLGRLEEEKFSSLIPGFYMEEFVNELEERHRLLYGVGLQEGLGLPANDARSFVQWMSGSWGRPRDWRFHLGPVTAWRQGDQSGRYLFWSDQSAPTSIDAVPSSREGIVRLVEDYFEHNARDITARKTIEWGSLSIDKKNNVSITYRFEATIRDRETKLATWEFTFAPNGGLLSLKEASNPH